MNWREYAASVVNSSSVKAVTVFKSLTSFDDLVSHKGMKIMDEEILHCTVIQR